MKFALIFVVVTKVFGTYSVVQEFADLPSCKIEQERLREFQRYVVSQDPHNAYLYSRCVPLSGGSQ